MINANLPLLVSSMISKHKNKVKIRFYAYYIEKKAFCLVFCKK